MSETETVSDAISTLFILFVGYVIVRSHGVVDGSVLGVAFEFVKFAAVVGLLFLVLGGLLTLFE